MFRRDLWRATEIVTTIADGVGVVATKIVRIE